MFRTLFWSLKKSGRLQKITRKLTPTPDGGESFTRAFAEGGFDAIRPRLDEEGKKEPAVKMIMDLSCSKALAVLRDENLLRDIAAIYKEQPKKQSA
jgi:hypothetical protein